MTLDKTEANPGETLYVPVPKLNEGVVIMPGLLALRFDIDLSGGHTNNFLVQNVTRALVSKLVVKFADKKTSGVADENRLIAIHGSKYRISLDHQILTDHAVFYSYALENYLVFELILAPALQVVEDSDPTKLKYKLTNIQLEYELMHSARLTGEAMRLYTSGTEFVYDIVPFNSMEPIRRDTDTQKNIKISTPRRLIMAILLLFVEPYAAGARDSEKFVYPDLKKVKISIVGYPDRIYNNDLEREDMWREASRFFMKEKHKPQHMNRTKFHAKDKFGLLIDLCSIASQEMHGSGTRLLDTKDGIILATDRDAKGSDTVNCHIYVIADVQFNIEGRKLHSALY